MEIYAAGYFQTFAASSMDVSPSARLLSGEWLKGHSMHCFVVSALGHVKKGGAVSHPDMVLWTPNIWLAHLLLLSSSHYS